MQKRNKLKQRVSGQIEYFSAAWRKQIKQIKQDIQMNHFNHSHIDLTSALQWNVCSEAAARRWPSVAASAAAQRDELTVSFSL